MPGRQVYPLEVDIEDFVPDILLGLCDRSVALDPGAVDEHVYPSIDLGGEIDEPFHIRRGGHVTPHPPDFEALFAQPASRLPAPPPVTIATLPRNSSVIRYPPPVLRP